MLRMRRRLEFLGFRLGLAVVGLGIGCAACPEGARAQDARGYRGHWNDWGYQGMALELNAWRTTVQAVDADSRFKVAASEWDGREWTHDGPIALATVGAAYAGGENTTLSAAVAGRYYTFAMTDVDYYQPGLMMVQETDNAPVEATSVSHEVGDLSATVSVGTSAALSAGEKVVVRYSVDGWQSSSFATATGSGTNWTATISHAPGEVGLACAYYVLTTTAAEPTHANADLQAIRWNHNGGANYGYAVAGTPPEAPTEQASGIRFAGTSSSETTAAWTNGNGAGRLVVARAGGPVDADPVDGTAYAANPAYGAGAEVGLGNYAVHAGTGAVVSVSGLPAGTAVHFRVYEYNGGGTSIRYNRATASENPASAATEEAPPHAVYLNEVLASNATGAQDEDGDFPDWIELYNAGSNAVSLLGWGLSDSYASPFKWTFGDVTMAPGEFLVVWASSKNRPAVTNGNQLHTSFAISAGGEEVTLTHPVDGLVDGLEPTAIPADMSVGRQPDGTGPWMYFAAPTPGSSNVGQGQGIGVLPPTFSVPGGIYSTTVTVALSTTVEGGVIRYTTDGSEPTETSPIYASPLSLGSRAGTPNGISEIPSNYLNPTNAYREGWIAPDGEVFKLHTIRARVFKTGALASAAPTQSYLVDAAGTNRYGLPVVSIATDAANLFSDEIGIYVPGLYNNYFQSGSEWERPGTIEFFEPDGTPAFAGQIGVRLHGNTTRSRPRKALRIYARSPSSFDYPIFPDKSLAKFDTFILRNGGNDWGDGVIRDLYLQSLAANTDLDRQYGRLAVVFVNGEYWGLHDLRERFDDEYMERNYGLSVGEFVQMEIDRDVEPKNIPTYDRGNPDLAQSYADLRSFIETSGVASAANYAAVQDQMDVDNFIDFYQAHIFFGNTDWPGNNVRMWRSAATNRTEGAPYGHDGRWRNMLYDADFGFGLNFTYVPGNENFTEGNDFGSFADHNTLAHAATDSGRYFSNHPDATMIFRRLLQNTNFAESFVTRFCDQLNTAYGRAHVTNEWARWVEVADREMGEHVRRWGQPFSWADEKARIRSYGEQRTSAVWGHLRGFFGLGAPRELTVSANPTQGVVRVNSLALDEGTAGFGGYPWTGRYFEEYPVELTAQARSGHRFAEWRQGAVAGDTVAEDEASNYGSWNDGSNGGTGFGSWSLNRSGDAGNSGYFLDTSRGGWGLYANSGQSAWAVRPFSSALASGQTFSVRMDHGWVEPDGNVGFALRNSQDEDLFAFSFSGGNSAYRINGADTGIGFTVEPIDVAITLTGATTFSARVSSGGSVAATTGAFQPRANLSASRFEGWNGSAGGGPGSDVFFNDLKIAEAAVGGGTTYSTDATVRVELATSMELEAVFAPMEEAETALAHYWNFNEPTTQLEPTYSIVDGAGMSVAPGALTVVRSDTGEDFAGENARFGDPAGAHLRINDPIGARLAVALPTTGFADVAVKYETRRSGSGAGTQWVSYTLDGTNYSPLATLVVTEIPTLHSFDFASIAGADDNAAFGLRIEFAQGGGGTAGNNRFDNWTLEGVASGTVNLPPLVVAPIPVRELVQGGAGEAVDVSGVFEDAEGDTLAYGASSSDPTVATASLAGTTVTVVPLKQGEATVTVTAADGHNPPATSTFRVLAYPRAHALQDGNYSFGGWAASEPAGSYPTNMIFLQGDENDSTLASPLTYAYRIPAADAALPQDVDYPYAATSRTRINGLGEEGVAFVNTGRGRDLGGALLALDTRNVENAPVGWLAGTLASSLRFYGIRLQYRVGTTGEFVDVVGADSQPVEYLRSDVAGHVGAMGPTELPPEALGQEYVQVLWRYYLVSGVDGARPQLRLDDLLVANSSALPAVALDFSVEPPAYAQSGQPMAAFAVRAVDAEGFTDVDWTQSVTLSLASGGGAMGGATSATAVAGVAQFDAAWIVGAGEHVLRASGGSLAAATSAPVVVDSMPVFVPGGDGSWNAAQNWSGLAVPGGVGAAAKILAPGAANRAVAVDEPVVVGALTVDNAASPYRNRVNGTTLTCNASSGHAALTVAGEGTGFVEFEVQGGVVLATNLDVAVHHLAGDPEHGALRLREAWSGPGGIVKSGAGVASFTGDGKTFSGPIVVEQGVLAFTQPSAPGTSAGTSVQPGGQVRLTSANDEFGARTYAFGGMLSLAGAGRTGVEPAENLGLLGALRYEPGSESNRAVVASPVEIAAAAGIHVSHESNEMELSGALTGASPIAKSGAGTLVLGGVGSTYSGTIEVDTGVLRVDGAFAAASVASVAATTVEGCGRLGGIGGAGTVSPGPGAAVLTAESVNGMSYRFDFSRAGTPDFGQPAASGNDVLRLAGAVPFAAALNAGNQIDVYFHGAVPTNGQAFEGGFYADADADFLAAIAGAAWRFFVPEGDGFAQDVDAAAYAVSTVAREADFGEGAVAGRILRIQVGDSEPATGYDAWRDGQFSQAELADPDVSGPLAEPDEPGVPNLLRYALGMGRADAYADFGPGGWVDGSEGPVYWHRRLLDAESGVEYVVETLVDWNAQDWQSAVVGEAGDLVERPPFAQNGDGTETVLYGVPVGGLEVPRYFRLRVRMVP
jgi:autotransporter-associated beta strand protein